MVAYTYMLVGLAFALGIAIGTLFTILIMVTVRINNAAFAQFIESPAIGGWKLEEPAYIAGLSDEESKFRESLPIDKQVEIL